MNNNRNRALLVVYCHKKNQTYFITPGNNTIVIFLSNSLSGEKSANEEIQSAFRIKASYSSSSFGWRGAGFEVGKHEGGTLKKLDGDADLVDTRYLNRLRI